MAGTEDWADITPEKDGGVLKRTIKEGEGNDHPLKGDTVHVHYTGTLEESGEKFDSSIDRNEPFEFTLAQGAVIKGWDIGVATMRKGEKCILKCREDYAYGSKGSPPKIPSKATLIFEIELLSWAGEDISPDRDGSIRRSLIVEGEKYSSPTEGSTVKVAIVGAHNGRVFFDSEISFMLGEGSEFGLPEGVDRALRRFNKGEKSRVHLKGKRFTYGTNPPPAYNLPENAELDFTMFLKECEKVKATWEMTGAEKLDAALEAKERGTMFLKQNKLRLAEAKYSRVIELLEFEKPLEEEEKKKRDALLLAGYLNSALAFAKQGETVECIKNCDKALEIDPKNVKALYRKALALQEQNDADEAIPIYKKVLELEPENKAAAAQIISCKKKLAVIREKEKKRFKGMFEKFAAKEKNEVPETKEEPTPMETESPKA